MNINVSTSIPSYTLSVKSTVENVEPEIQFVQNIEKKTGCFFKEGIIWNVS